jgi:hypothetical protein
MIHDTWENAAPTPMWLEDRGVVLVGEGHTGLDRVVQALLCVPKRVIACIGDANSHVEMIHGRGVTQHPLYTYLSGKTPRGWGSGMWDECSGCGGEPGWPAVVLSNSWRGTETLLHELGHTFDCCWEGGFLALADEWLQLHSVNWWPEYEQQHPEESWAESFRRYLTDQSDPLLYPEVGRYFSELLGEGRDPMRW